VTTAKSKTGRCPKCLGLDWNCECHEDDEREEPVAWFEFAGEGRCVGCDRKVRNTWRKANSRGSVACLRCLWAALAK
jgi:hypothetical protein